MMAESERKQHKQKESRCFKGWWWDSRSLASISAEGKSLTPHTVMKDKETVESDKYERQGREER